MQNAKDHDLYLTQSPATNALNAPNNASTGSPHVNNDAIEIVREPKRRYPPPASAQAARQYKLRAPPRHAREHQSVRPARQRSGVPERSRTSDHRCRTPRPRAYLRFSSANKRSTNFGE